MKRTMGWFDLFEDWLSVATGRSYNYRVKFIYVGRNGQRIWSFTSTVCFTYRARVGAMREVKRAMFPRGIKAHPRFTNVPLNNGELEVEPTCYLGWY